MAKKKKLANAQNGERKKDGIVCSIEGCDNLCWTKRLATTLRSDWVYKLKGKYVCEVSKLSLFLFTSMAV